MDGDDPPFFLSGICNELGGRLHLENGIVIVNGQDKVCMVNKILIAAQIAVFCIAGSNQVVVGTLFENIVITLSPFFCLLL